MRGKWIVILGFLLVFVFPFAVFAQTTVVTVLGMWSGQELEAFQKVIDIFTAETGISVQFEGTKDLSTFLQARLDADNPPDLAVISGPGIMRNLVDQGALVDLSDILDSTTLKADVSDALIELGTYNNALYGLVFATEIKSLVWYRPDQFAAQGYKVPATWDEMDALMDQMVANGDVPWAIGLESGVASGWPATDWIEDILLRTAGPEVYEQWVEHQIPWTDPRIKEAFEIFGKVAGNSKYVYGGSTTVLATNFEDSVAGLFVNPPLAMMHRQAGFIADRILDTNPGMQIGQDVDFFLFPAIKPEHGNSIVGTGDMVIQFNEIPEATAFMQFLVSIKAQEVWVRRLGKLGSNNKIDQVAYPDNLTRKMARMLNETDVFKFDGSDSMPTAVGSGAFQVGTLMYVGGENLDKVLEFIEKVAVDSY